MPLFPEEFYQTCFNFHKSKWLLRNWSKIKSSTLLGWTELPQNTCLPKIYECNHIGKSVFEYIMKLPWGRTGSECTGIPVNGPCVKKGEFGHRDTGWDGDWSSSLQAQEKPKDKGGKGKETGDTRARSFPGASR